MAEPEIASEHTRIREAYLIMAKEARYRPAAPSDGFGNIQLTVEQCRDQQRLEEEATEYANRFIAEENGLAFDIGCSNWQTNRALVFTIEAARLLCGGADELATELLSMAIAEIRSENEVRDRSSFSRASRRRGGQGTARPKGSASTKSS